MGVAQPACLLLDGALAGTFPQQLRSGKGQYSRSTGDRVTTSPL